MIVDVHTHCWPRLECFSPSFQADARRMRVNAVNLVSRHVYNFEETVWPAAAGTTVVALTGCPQAAR